MGSPQDEQTLSQVTAHFKFFSFETIPNSDLNQQSMHKYNMENPTTGVKGYTCNQAIGKLKTKPY